MRINDQGVRIKSAEGDCNWSMIIGLPLWPHQAPSPETAAGRGMRDGRPQPVGEADGVSRRGFLGRDGALRFHLWPRILLLSNPARCRPCDTAGAIDWGGAEAWPCPGVGLARVTLSG